MNKVIWITGASSGIGAELAIQYAKEDGISLILSARREKQLDEVKSICDVKTPIALLPFDLINFEKG